MNWIKVEPHAHTAEVSACGRLTARQMVEEVKAAGYDMVVVTDHYNPEIFEGYTQGGAYRRRVRDFFYAGYRLAKEHGEKVGLAVLPALELRTDAGQEDYLIYGVSPKELEEMGCLAHLPLQKVLELVHACGGLLYQAHPFRNYLRCMPPELMDGVEVCNANPRHDSHNDQALAFAKKYGLRMEAGSDVHQAGDAGRAGLRMPVCKDEKAFCQALRQGESQWFCSDAP